MTGAAIVTLTGAPLTLRSARPNARLMRDDMQSNAELLAPLSDALFRLGGEALRLLSILGGDKQEALRLIEAEIEARYEMDNTP